MPQRFEIYRCGICGNIVYVLEGHTGELLCCEVLMKLMLENTTDAAEEKHIPIIRNSGDGIIVKVGSVLHPMDENHYIMWVEAVNNEKSCIKFLRPGDNPEVVFEGLFGGGYIRAYCNLHGLWRCSCKNTMN